MFGIGIVVGLVGLPDFFGQFVRSFPVLGLQLLLAPRGRRRRV